MKLAWMNMLTIATIRDSLDICIEPIHCTWRDFRMRCNRVGSMQITRSDYKLQMIGNARTARNQNIKTVIRLVIMMVCSKSPTQFPRRRIYFQCGSGGIGHI